MAKASSWADRLSARPVRVAKWSGAEAKVALDDLVCSYAAEEARLSPDHGVLHAKLAGCALLALIGGAVALYSWLTPFESAKVLTVIGAVLYLLVLSAYSYWLAVVLPPGVFFRGKGKRGACVWLASRLSMPQGEYELSLIDSKASDRAAASSDTTTPATLYQWAERQCAAVRLRLPLATHHRTLARTSVPLAAVVRADGTVDPSALAAFLDAFRTSSLEPHVNGVAVKQE